MTNKTIMITGATSGFGEACARVFANNGWQLILTGRRQQRLDDLQQELGGKDKVATCCFDVTDRKAVETAIHGLAEPFKKIDVLLNNAGLALGLEPAQETNLDDWEKMVDTNIKGLLYCTRTILPMMTERKSGYVINIGSVAGNWPYPGGNVYCGTKAFVRQFSLATRADLLGTNVRVTNVEPGNAETEFSKVRFKDDGARADKVYEGTRALDAEDIANTVWWLVNTPEHVNVTTIEVMPTQEANGPMAFHRQ